MLPIALVSLKGSVNDDMMGEKQQFYNNFK